MTWTAGGAAAPWRSVASSADGTKFYAAGVGLWASTNSGVTWAARNGSAGWNFVTCSADGTKLVVSSGFYTPVFTSTDSGMTVTERASSLYSVDTIASSADGTKLVVATPGQDIYTSADSGLTWVDQTESLGLTDGLFWSSVACSTNGTKIVAVVHGGWIYTSTDSGVTWTPRDSSRTWNSVASSADGTKLVAAVFNGPIYTSTNSGTNWTAGKINPDFSGGGSSTDTNINRGWRSVACSADGTKLVAVDNPGGGTNGLIYISGVVIVPKLNIINLGSNVGVSWPYPSTGWTLQQSSNLTTASWSPSSGVTNNGHSNYILTSPAGKMFFRLLSPP